MNKKIIPFYICGVLAWLSLASAFIYLWAIDRPQKTLTEQTAAVEVRQRNSDENSMTFSTEKKSITSSVERFDTLTTDEKVTINILFEELIADDLNVVLQEEAKRRGIDVRIVSGVECNNDIVYFYIDTDDVTMATSAMKSDLVEIGLELAKLCNEMVCEAYDKQLDYGYFVYYKGKLEYTVTNSGRDLANN